MKPRTIAIFAAVAAAILSLATRSIGAVKGSPLDKRVSLTSLSNGAEFQELCHDVGIPCGFERIASPGHANTEMPMEEDTLRGALNSLIRMRMPEYSWRFADGVLQMAPSDVLEGRVASPLDKILPTVDIRDTPTDRAAVRICELAHVARGSGNFSGLSQAPFPRVSLHLKNVTVRQALNHLVRQDGKALWHVYPSDGDLGIAIESYRPATKKPDSGEYVPPRKFSR